MSALSHESGTKNFSGDVNDTWDVLQTTSPNTTAATFVFAVDTSALVAGDTLEIRVEAKIISGGTLRVAYHAVLTGVQARPGWFSPALILLNGWDFSMRQRAGTGRSIPWEILKIP